MKKRLVFATVGLMLMIGGGVAAANRVRHHTTTLNPPAGITSINAHPIGTAGSATEGVGPMNFVSP